MERRVHGPVPRTFGRRRGDPDRRHHANRRQPRRPRLAARCADQLPRRSALRRRPSSAHQSKQRKVLERFAASPKGAPPDKQLGAKPLAGFSAGRLQQYFDQLSPDSQRDLAKGLSAFFRWAKAKKLVATVPTAEITLRPLPKREAPTWTEQQFAQIRDRWPVGSDERLFLEAAVNSAARGPSDLRAFGRQHVATGRIVFQARKNGRNQAIPILPDFQRCLDALPPGTMQFFTVQDGSRVMAPETFGVFVRSLVREAGLGGLRLTSHGLRRLSACRFRAAGCSTAEIAALLGDSEQVVQSVLARLR